MVGDGFREIVVTGKNIHRNDSIIGTPLSSNATKVLLLGAGELGKELVIELQRFGVEVTAVDRYKNAPAMQVAHRSYVIDMLNPAELRRVVEVERPNFIIPEIEAIATAELMVLESEGYNVVPSAKAVHLTMNREGIRRLVAEDLGIPTSLYQFANTYEEFVIAVAKVGVPCIVKPIMSSSGKGQSTVYSDSDIDSAWHYAQEGGRAGAGKVIVEGVVDFEYEITLLTCRHRDGITFCEPIGHLQVDGDYRESWQPQEMSCGALSKAKEIAEQVTTALGGWGIFGVELFVRGEDVFFSEVSPRPHDTGLVTLISQDLSEFAMHVRAILGMPVNSEGFKAPSASKVLLAKGVSGSISYSGLGDVLSVVGVDFRLFGKAEVSGIRRVGVVLAKAQTVDNARSSVSMAARKIKIHLN